MGGGSSREFEIMEDGEHAYTQIWDFPSRDQCITCHNDNADYVLGFKTHQLNKSIKYDFMTKEINQLDFYNQEGIFNKDIGNAGFELKSYPISDESVDLQKRIQSYLDANCSSCHQEGGIPDINLDFRYTKSSNIRSYIDFPTSSHASISDRNIIKLGDHTESELWVRDNSIDNNKMPPLGRNFVDQIYVDSLAKWIENLDPNSMVDHHELIVFPNPTTGWIGLRIDDDWPIPYFIDISSISGKTIWQTSSENSFEYFNLSNYPLGTYLLTVRSDDKLQTRKFVIQ